MLQIISASVMGSLMFYRQGRYVDINFTLQINLKYKEKAPG